MLFSTARRTGLAALGTASAVLITLLSPAPAGAAASAAPPEGSSGRSGGPARTVTLITGDKVVVTPGTGGGRDTLSVERRPGAAGSVRIVTEGATPTSTRTTRSRTWPRTASTSGSSTSPG